MTEKQIMCLVFEFRGSRLYPPSLPLRSVITRVMELVLKRKPLRETEGNVEYCTVLIDMATSDLGDSRKE